MTSIYYRKSYQRAFGTWPLKGEELRGALSAALEVGYRAIDTAQMYENEADVGAALAASGVPREELLITTKVSPKNFSADAFIASVQKSLEDLRIDQIDVLLLHWPPEGGDVAPSLRLLSEARAKGLTAQIGVSNYTVAMLKTAQATIPDPLVTNQVEFHPLLNQDALMQGATALGVPLSSYCSIARGEIFKHAAFAQIGEAYGKSAAQIALRWILQKGVSINTMSTKPQNIAANFDVMDFTLSHVDMARIDTLTGTNHRIVTANAVPWAPDWD